MNVEQKSIQSLQRDISDLGVEASTHERKAGDARRMLGASLRELRDRLTAGGATTGDRLTDFTFVAHTDDFNGHLTRYRNLQDRLKGMNLQLALLYERWMEEQQGERYFDTLVAPHRGGSFTITHESLYLVQLTGEELVVDLAGPTLALPANKYVFCPDFRSGTSQRVVEEKNLPLGAGFLQTLAKQESGNFESEVQLLNEVLFRRRIGDVHCDLVIGNDDVWGWFTRFHNGHYQWLHRDLAALLGVTIHRESHAAAAQ